MIQSSPVNTEIFNVNFIKNRKLYENCSTEILNKIKNIKTVLKTDRASNLKELKDILCSDENNLFFPKLSNIYIILYYDVNSGNIINYFKFEKRGDIFGSDAGKIWNQEDSSILVLEDVIKLSNLNPITKFFLNRINEVEFEKEYIDELIKLLILQLNKIKKLQLKHNKFYFVDKKLKFFIKNAIYLDEQIILNQINNQRIFIELFKNHRSLLRGLVLLKKQFKNSELIKKIELIQFIFFVSRHQTLSDKVFFEFVNLNITNDIFEDFLSFIIDSEDSNYIFFRYKTPEIVKFIFNKLELLGSFNKKYLKLNNNDEIIYDCPTVNIDTRKNLECIFNNIHRKKTILSVFFEKEIVYVYSDIYDFSYRSLPQTKNAIFEVSIKRDMDYNILINNLYNLNKYLDTIYIYVNNKKDYDISIDKVLDINLLKFYNKNKINLNEFLSKVVVLDNSKPLKDHFENKILINYY